MLSRRSNERGDKELARLSHNIYVKDINEIQKIFAERLRDLMSEKEFKNISDFARKINIPSRSINGWLICARTVKVDSLVRIAEFFNVSTDYLLGVKNEF